MFIWTPVMMGYGSLKEVEQDWNINDVVDSFNAMEIKAKLEEMPTKT